jgi:hypothetical protein
MHYRAIAFSKDRLSATIVPKDNKAFFTIGQRVRFSPMDLAKLNTLYNCDPSYYRQGDTHSLPSEPEKGSSSEDLFHNTGMKKHTSSTEVENKLFPNPETETDTSPSKHEDNLFSKFIVQNHTPLPKAEKDIPIEGSFSEPGIEKEISSSKPEDFLPEIRTESKISLPKLDKDIV